MNQDEGPPSRDELIAIARHLQSIGNEGLRNRNLKTRNDIKKLEKSLEICRKIEMRIEKNRDSDQEYDRKMQEIREEISGIEHEMKVLELIVQLFKVVADGMKWDIEDNWRLKIQRFLHNLHHRLHAPPVLHQIHDNPNSIWILDILLGLLMFYVYFTF